MKRPLDIALGKRIRQLRKRFHLPREADLAAELGVTRAAVGNWERGTGASSKALIAMAERFGVSLNWLMAGRGKMIATGWARLGRLSEAVYLAFEADVMALVDQRLQQCGVRP